MYNFRGFGAGLEFGFPYLVFFVEGHEIFLKLSSKVVDILLGSVEHESCIHVMISCGWGAVCVPLNEIFSVKEGPTICP